MNIKVSRNVMCYNPYNINTKQRDKWSGGCRNKMTVNAEHDEWLTVKVFKIIFQFFRLKMPKIVCLIVLIILHQYRAIVDVLPKNIYKKPIENDNFRDIIHYNALLKSHV